MLARIHDEMLDSVSHLDHDTQARVILAYVEYQLRGVEPDPSDTLVYSMFKAKQYDLDLIVKDVQSSVNNGKLGGRPVKTFDNSQKPKHNLSEPKHNLREPDKEKEKDNENDKENENKNKIEQKEKYGDFVLLTQSEHARLVNEFGLSTTNYQIDALNDYIGSTGKRYKSHYHTIRSWIRREGGNGKSSSSIAMNQALERRRSKVREQIDGYLHANESNDAGPKEQNSSFDRRGQILGS